MRNNAKKSMMHYLILLFVFMEGSNVQGYDDPNQRYLPPVQVAGWQLGVSVRNLRGGVAINRVLPVSAASQSGLEVGDVIITVNGVPVGFTGGVLNDLEDELNRQADRLGRVTLRIRNGRDGSIRNVPVRLAPVNAWQPPAQPPWWDVQRPPVRPPVQPPWWDVQPQPQFPPVDQLDPVRQTIAELYGKYFGRQPDNIGMLNWITQVQQGMRIEEVHANILASAEFYDRCSNNDAEWVAQLYNLVIGRRANRDEIRQWVQALRQFEGQRLLLAREFLKAIGQY